MIGRIWNNIYPFSPKKWCMKRMLTHEQLVRESYKKLNEELKDKGYEVVIEIKQELRKL